MVTTGFTGFNRNIQCCRNQSEINIRRLRHWNWEIAFGGVLDKHLGTFPWFAGSLVLQKLLLQSVWFKFHGAAANPLTTFHPRAFMWEGILRMDHKNTLKQVTVQFV